MALGIGLFMASIAFITGAGIYEADQQRDHTVAVAKYKDTYKKSFIPVMTEGMKFCVAPKYIDKDGFKIDYNTISSVARRQAIKAIFYCRKKKVKTCLWYVRIVNNKYTYGCRKQTVYKVPKSDFKLRNY